ncbi:MAG: hypothetical protein Q9210_006606 [Variospora velana]
MFLKQIPRPVVSADEIATLVGALDNGAPDICSRLNDMAFQTVYAFLKISEPCLARQRGHCLFVESLHSSKATTRAQKTSLTAKKSALGRNVLVRLIRAFLGSPQSNRARRGIGSLALELLRDCPENKDLVSTKETASLRQALGHEIMEGKDEVLRLIASTMIREFVDNGQDVCEFLPVGNYPDPSGFFQDKKKYTSQWTTEFVDYVDNLEDPGIMAKERNLWTFAYAVSVGGTSYSTESGLSILVTITDNELTVVIPATEADTAKYIDVPFEHITDMRLTEGCPGSQPQRLTATRPTVLALNVSGGSTVAYYINDSGRASCEIVLAFDRLDDADSVKAQIERSTAQREDSNGRNEERGTTQANPDVSKYLVELSQGDFVDVSDSQPGQDTNQGDTASQQEPISLRGTRPSDVAFTASGAHHVPLESLRRAVDGKGGQQGSNSDKGTNKAFATGISVATAVIDVGPELTYEDGHGQGRSNSEDASIVGPSNSTTWRDGMEIIETAQEFKVAPAIALPSAHTGMLQMSNSPAAVPADHDDLYSATPRQPMMQPAQKTSINLHQETGESYLRTMASTDTTKESSATSRKLSKSMRQAGSERSVAHPSTAGAISTRKGKPSISKSKSSVAPRPSTSKRKGTPVTETTVPSKKQKIKDVTPKKSNKSKKDPDSSYAPATDAEYDIPATPVNPKLPAGRLKKGQPKVAKNSRSVKTVQPAQTKGKDKIAKAKPSVPKRSPKRTRAAAQTAMRQMRDLDTRREVEDDKHSDDVMTADVSVLEEGIQQVLNRAKPERSSDNLSEVSDRGNMPQQLAIPGGPVPQPPAALPTNAFDNQEVRMSELSRMPENRTQEEDTGRSRLPRLLTPGPSHVVIAEVQSRDLHNPTADDYMKNPSGAQTVPLSRRIPQPLLQLSEALPNNLNPGLLQQPMAPTRAPVENTAPSNIHDNKKRPRYGVDEQHSSHKKMKRTPRADWGHDLDGVSTGMQKDPSRLPQIIGFSAMGPRNQGISSPAVVHRDLGQKTQPGRRTPGPSLIQKAKGDIGSIITGTSNVSIPDSAQVSKHSEAEEMGENKTDDVTTFPDNPLLQPEQPIFVEQPLLGRAKGAFPKHRSVSFEDHVPKISSQGSRVNENGSPLPSQRMGFPRGKVRYVDEESGSEDAGPRLGDDETTFVQDEYENPPEIGLPPNSAAIASRSRRFGFLGSSNSKHGPSSPSAPSGMLSAVQPHTVEADGEFVHVHTEAVLVPSRPQDPFASQQIQRPNRFADKLRRVSRTAQGQDRNTVGFLNPPRSCKDAATMTEQEPEQNPDPTHAEPLASQSRRRVQVAPTATDTSSSSSSEVQSRSPSVSNAHDQRWRDALEPHHQNTLAVLYEISHRLIGHLVDAETAIYDVVKDYRRRGERMVKNFADDLEREVEQYSRTAETRRDEVTRKNKEWLVKITKNLQREPKAGALREQLEERKRALDAEVEMVMGLCAE